jgi:hypothetical protein
MLGTSKRSFAYKSDGKIYHGKNTGEEFGPKFEKNDVIGCGLLISRKEIFFTLNSRLLGVAYKNVELFRDSLYPSVCL